MADRPQHIVHGDASSPGCHLCQSGATNTGTIDPVQELAQIAHHEGLWYHVDAAYGGFFQLTERGRERLAGIEHADSVVLDPHKCVPIFCIQTF
jgi:aromatic-L-amino-acid decarboxylase